MAPIGTIKTALALDKSDFQGPHDPITGNVTLTFQPNTANQELFGPLHLRVILQGERKLHVSENRTSHAYIFFDENRLLFRRTQEICSGEPLRVPAGKPEKVPFQICFPSAPDAYMGSRKGEGLPPSFKTRFQVQAPRQYGKHQGAAKVEYSVRAEAELPGIDVEVVNDTSTVIRYEQPSRAAMNTGGSTGTHELSETLQVETHQLLPEHQRPSSLLGRTKAVLSNVPKPVFAFMATCVCFPDVIAVGQSIHFELRVQVDSKATTATTSPEIALGDDSKIDIIARTELYATNEKSVNSPQLENSTILHRLKLAKQDPEGPFTKSSDHTKTITFEVLPLDIPSSFSIPKLSRSYKAQVELRFVVAGTQTAVMTKRIPLRVLAPSPEQLAPPYTSSANGTSAAGPSRLGFESIGVNEHEELPLYEEAVGSARG